MAQDPGEQEALVQGQRGQKEHPRTSPTEELIVDVSKKFSKMFSKPHDKKMATGRKSIQDAKIAEMADIISAYRGLAEDDDEKEAIPWYESPCFNLSICIVIALNIFVMGLELDLGDDDKEGYDRNPVWIALEWLFCVIFVGELVIKVKYYRKSFFSEAWNWLTLFIASMAFVDVVILAPLKLSGKLRMLSLVRIVNLLRLKRVMSEYRMLKELELVLKGLVGCMLNLAWAVALLLVILYVFAIFAVTAIGSNQDSYQRVRKLGNGWDHEALFGTIGRSMLTLIQMMTLDTWSSGIARQVLDQQWHMIFFFILFMVLTTFGIMNLIVAIVVEQTLNTTRETAQRSRAAEERARNTELHYIKTIFLLLDTDCSGELNMEEFVEGCEDSEVQWRLRAIELNRNDAKRLFQVIDGTGSRTLTMDEFIEGCTKLKGVARSKDLLALQSQATAMSKNMDLLGFELQDSEKMLARLDVATERMTIRFEPTVAGAKRQRQERVRGTAPTLPEPHTKAHQRGPGLNAGNQPQMPGFPNLLSADL